jgi:hypothetical protein
MRIRNLHLLTSVIALSTLLIPSSPLHAGGAKPAAITKDTDAPEKAAPRQSLLQPVPTIKRAIDPEKATPVASKAAPGLTLKMENPAATLVPGFVNKLTSQMFVTTKWRVTGGTADYDAKSAGKEAIQKITLLSLSGKPPKQTVSTNCLLLVQGEHLTADFMRNAKVSITNGTEPEQMIVTFSAGKVVIKATLEAMVNGPMPYIREVSPTVASAGSQ